MKRADAMLNQLICYIPNWQLSANLKAAETELAHCMYCHADPLEALEWVDLYRREVAHRQIAGRMHE